MATEQELEILRNELHRKNVLMEAVLERYGIASETLITEDIYRKAMNDLKQTKRLRKAA